MKKYIHCSKVDTHARSNFISPSLSSSCVSVSKGEKKSFPIDKLSLKSSLVQPAQNKRTLVMMELESRDKGSKVPVAMD